MANKKQKMRKGNWREQIPLHVIIMPGVIATFIFSYIPMYGLLIAFKNFLPTKGILGSKWVGLKHFQRLFRMSDFYRITRNTLVVASLKIVTLLVVSLILALLLNEIRKRRIRGTIQSFLIFPHFLSWIILGGLVRGILAKDGMVNNLIQATGHEPILFLGDGTWFTIVLIVTNLWQEAGFAAILYTAAIAGIDGSLYEAAAIDGANRWQQMRHITIQCIKPFIILLAVLNIGNVLNAGFDQIFNLYNGLVLNTADVIDTYVYRVGLQGAQYSFGTAVGFFKSVVALVLIGISYYLADKLANYRVF